MGAFEFMTTDPIFTGAVGLMSGAIASTCASYYGEKLKLRRDAVFSLHKEWSDMMELRSMIELELAKEPDSRVLDHSALMLKIWVVLAFFERLQFYYSRGVLSRRTTCALFGENFHWWFKKVVMSDLNLYAESQTTRSCIDLHIALWRSASKEERRKWVATERFNPKASPTRDVGIVARSARRSSKRTCRF